MERAGEFPAAGRPARGRRPPSGEPVLDRAFRILAAFGPDSRSLSLTELSRRTGLPKPTALRLARKLTEWGALERAASGEYVVGLRLLEVASLAPRGHGLRATALPFLEDLHHSTGQHVLLAVRDGLEAVLVERLSARRAGRVLYRVGGRLPLHSTGVGLIMLAYAPAAVSPRGAGPACRDPPGRRGGGVACASGADDVGGGAGDRPGRGRGGRALRRDPVRGERACRAPAGRGGDRAGGLARCGRSRRLTQP
jgi:hypothetical protein